MREWSAEEEQELIELYRQGMSIEALAAKYSRSEDAVRMKLKRLGIAKAEEVQVTGILEVPEELPSLEEVLKIVAAALQKACQPGLSRTELQRLAVISGLYKSYADGLERYVNYSKIEKKLLEMEAKYAELFKKIQSL
ncbi:MAG: hypothetical protein QW056_02285 [Candidatus Bathyarchaeia archaeon]